MRLMPSVLRYETPARVWPETAKLFDSFFRDFPLSGFPLEKEAGTPAVDILEKDNNLILRAELPGMEEKDIQLALDGNVLTLKGERKLQDESVTLEALGERLGISKERVRQIEGNALIKLKRALIARVGDPAEAGYVGD